MKFALIAVIVAAITAGIVMFAFGSEETANVQPSANLADEVGYTGLSSAADSGIPIREIQIHMTGRMILTLLYQDGEEINVESEVTEMVAPALSISQADMLPTFEVRSATFHRFDGFVEIRLHEAFGEPNSETWLIQVSDEGNLISSQTAAPFPMKAGYQ